MIHTPFKFLDFDDLEAIKFAGARRLKDCICPNGAYRVYLFKADGQEKEFMIFAYYEPGDDEAVLPDHIWSRILIGPSFGEGTQMLQHGLLSMPLMVINSINEESIMEVQNDGIVAFEVNGDKEVGKSLYLWMKNHEIEHVFKRLGEQIIDTYVSQLNGGEAKRLLIQK
jgi:hypothetical protein